MKKRIKMISLLVRDFDEAIAFYVEKLGFVLKQDESYGEGHRWVTLHAPGQRELEIGLGLAKTEDDLSVVGKQAGSFPLYALDVEDCFAEYEAMKAKGVRFVQPATQEPFGINALLEDLYGNRIYMRQMGL